MGQYEINFTKALANLQRAEKQAPLCDELLAKAGMVKLFSLCYEQAWQAMKEILIAEDAAEEKASPREIIQAAHEAGLITDKESWLLAMKDRSLEMEAFEEEVALAIIKNTKEIFIPLFEELAKTLQAREK